MKLSTNVKLICRPDSESEISKIAERAIKRAGAMEVLPTPVDDLVKAAAIMEVQSPEELKESFFARLTKSAQETFKYAIQKVRGIADLRDRINYIPQNGNPCRNLFPKAHEFGHQIIPWHNINTTYLDDDYTLSPDVETDFDREANFFASEVIFQGKSFRVHALDYVASLHAVFRLSEMYGASKQATIWRYIEEQDEAIAVAQYYPIDSTDEHGNHFLRHWKTIPSKKFIKKYEDIELPSRIGTGHPWVAARDIKFHDGINILEGKDLIRCGMSEYTFEWQAWWNGYTLFVLLRHKPILGVISKIIK
ncbi:MAG: hypothetical protein FD156_424 [Nitrospirae bacterium]|nr:MAG: hypothetical protein FD156_424 [Nitrospirota bacterium]